VKAKRVTGQGSNAERLAVRDAFTQPGGRHVGPVGKIDDWLRWPDFHFLQGLNWRIARPTDCAQRNCHDAVPVGLFAFAGDDGPSFLDVEDWDGPATPSAIGAARPFPHHAWHGGIFTLFRFEMR
jgi:hypothetical protein